MISTQINTQTITKSCSTNNWVQKYMYFGLKIPILTQYRPVVVQSTNTNKNNHSKQTDTTTTTTTTNVEPNH